MLNCDRNQYISHVCALYHTAEHVIEILSLSDWSVILVFVAKGCCIYLMASVLMGRHIQGG